MGINFDDYVFDLVLYMNDNDLLDINFRNWNYNKEEKWYEKILKIIKKLFKFFHNLLFQAKKCAYKAIIGTFYNI